MLVGQDGLAGPCEEGGRDGPGPNSASWRSEPQAADPAARGRPRKPSLAAPANPNFPFPVFRSTDDYGALRPLQEVPLFTP